MPPRRTAIKKAEIGRFDSDLKSVGFKTNDTVQHLLDKAGLSLSSGEEINDASGKAVNTSDKAKATQYHIVGNYKNGQ